MAKKNDELLQGLAALGCGLRDVEGSTFIALPDEYAEFVFDRLGEWLYLGTTFMTPEEFADSAYSETFNRFLLELQDRNLGCHFSYDRHGYLTIGTELFQNQLAAKHVLQVMDQIAFVIEVCIPLCDQILETGKVPSDAEVDDAFGTSEKLH